MKLAYSPALKSALAVALIAAIGTTVLALANSITRDVIIQREDEEKMRLVDQLLPHELYDNRLLRDTIKVSENSLLGTGETTLAYRARLRGQPSAALFETVAPDGYGGKIRLMVCVRPEGQLTGVRVLAHNETVGWGDYIEIEKSKWIKMFDQKSLGENAERSWQVKKDGGNFDYVARATVSARAIVGGVYRALNYHAAHKEQLYSDARVIE